MSDLRDLIRACKAEPDDDAPRLVLADWLEEHGEEDRARFIRRQVSGPEGDAAANFAKPEWFGEWKRWADEWMETRSGNPVYPARFDRGFFRIGDYYRELYDLLPALLEWPYDWTWLEEIRFGSWHDGDWTPSFQSPRLLELTRLEFIDDDYNSNLLEPLLASPYLSSLRHLRLVMVNANDDGFARLSDRQSLAGLRSLDLTEMGLGPASARALATTELWDQLRTCTVIGSRFGDAGLAELARGRSRRRLERLDLTIGGYSDDGLVDLARSECFPAVRELGVGYRTLLDNGGRFGREGIQALLNGPQFGQVRITVSIISDEPVPQELCDLACSHPTRLVVRYRNPRLGTPGFQYWPSTAGPGQHEPAASGAA